MCARVCVSVRLVVAYVSLFTSDVTASKLHYNTAMHWLVHTHTHTRDIVLLRLCAKGAMRVLACVGSSFLSLSLRLIYNQRRGIITSAVTEDSCARGARVCVCRLEL